MEAFIADLYVRLGNIPFPESALREHVPKMVQLSDDIGRSISVRWPTAFLALMAMSSFALHRAQVKMTGMLDVAPVVWFAMIGRSGDSEKPNKTFYKTLTSFGAGKGSRPHVTAGDMQLRVSSI